MAEALWKKKKRFGKEGRKGTQRITGDLPLLARQSNFEPNSYVNWGEAKLNDDEVVATQ